MVGSQPVAMGVRVGEEAALEKSVLAWLYSRDDIGRGEGGLLDLRVVVVGIAVENELTERNERVVLVRPNLSDIEDIPSVGLCVLLGHDLDHDRP